MMPSIYRLKGILRAKNVYKFGQMSNNNLFVFKNLKGGKRVQFVSFYIHIITIFQTGIPDYRAEDEELKIIKNRRKYKKEANCLINTQHRFKRFNQIHIKENDPVNVLMYPSYYLSYLDDEQDKFYSELDLCNFHLKNLKSSL